MNEIPKIIYLNKEFKEDTYDTATWSETKIDDDDIKYIKLDDNEQVITWHNVADGLPKVEKEYIVKDDYFPNSHVLLFVDNQWYEHEKSEEPYMHNIIKYAELPKIKEG